MCLHNETFSFDEQQSTEYEAPEGRESMEWTEDVRAAKQRSIRTLPIIY